MENQDLLLKIAEIVSPTTIIKNPVVTPPVKQVDTNNGLLPPPDYDQEAYAAVVGTEGRTLDNAVLSHICSCLIALLKLQGIK